MYMGLRRTVFIPTQCFPAHRLQDRGSTHEGGSLAGVADRRNETRAVNADSLRESIFLKNCISPNLREKTWREPGVYGTNRYPSGAHPLGGEMDQHTGGE